MIKARASGSKVYLYFMKKGRLARHRIPRNSCFLSTWSDGVIIIIIIICICTNFREEILNGFKDMERTLNVIY